MTRRKFVKGSAIVGAAAATPIIVKQSGLLDDKSKRKVYQILQASSTMVGTLPILRAFAGDREDYVSPFVLFDEFGPVQVNAGDAPLRVDAHPHAGVIPTTYFIEGSGHHKDSLNYDFQIGKGDFMLFSSGRGAIHMEESGGQLVQEGGTYHGFQIWLNMPAVHKFDAPSTTVFGDEKMGLIETDKYSIKVILGSFGKVKSETEMLSPAFYYHITMKTDSRLDIPTDPTHNAFLYLVDGELELEGKKLLRKNQIALYERNANYIDVYAEKGANFLVLGGQPLHETVYSYGPFVMNNEQQIRQCIQNYQTGKMGDPDLVN